MPPKTEDWVAHVQLGLMYVKPRTSTVSVSKPGALWVIDRKVFKAVVKYGGAVLSPHTFIWGSH